ncbi:hypothetical protein MTO96_048954 [Rhipicephalus appendiculatus]
MPAFCFAHGCTSTDGRDDVLGLLLSGGSGIGQMPGPSNFTEIDHHGITAEPVHQASPGPASFKLQVIEYAEEHGKREAGRKYDVDEKRVRYWIKQKDALAATNSRSTYALTVHSKRNFADVTLNGWLEAAMRRPLQDG